jgi:ABC-2 type transport system permease protein
LWAVAFGVTIAASALSYVSSFPTAQSRRQVVAVTSSDSGLAVLLGPVSAVGTPGGYTVYKGYVFLTTIGAVWALLSATRLLRGEEEAGRWQLVLAGATRAPRAVAATLAGIGAGILVVGAGSVLGALAAGADRRVGFGMSSSVLYGFSLMVAPAVFAAVGAVSSQLARTRRAAAGWGMAVMGAAFLVRMVADAGEGLRWLRWTTPFGWIELVDPFGRNAVLPFLPAVVATVVFGVAACLLAGRRDLGAGVLGSRDSSAPRSFGLGSPWGMVVRSELGVLTGWGVAAATTGLVLGIIAKMTSRPMPGSVGGTLGRFGVDGTFVDQYLGVAFLLVAVVVAMVGAGQIRAARDEEASGRLTNLLVQPCRRPMLLGGRLSVAAMGIVAAAALAGLGTWAGARLEHVPVSLPTMLAAGMNVVPPALLALGVGALVLAVAPRRSAAAVTATVVWSLFADLLGAMVASLGWIERLSLFHYMALAPAQDVQPLAVAVMLTIAAASVGGAVALFSRRDLRLA